jgi:hypothetical protein
MRLRRRAREGLSLGSSGERWPQPQLGLCDGEEEEREAEVKPSPHAMNEYALIGSGDGDGGK